MKNLDSKISELVQKYNAGFFVGLEGDVNHPEAYCTSCGSPSDLVTALVSIVHDSADVKLSNHIKNLLFHSVITLMMTDPDYAGEFFGLLDKVTGRQECQVINHDFTKK